MTRFQLLISPDAIQRKIVETAHLLNTLYAGEELTLVMVMKGAFCLAADLMRQLQIPCTLEYCSASSYGQRGTKRGELTVSGLDHLDLTSRHVLLVDDIFDSGNTLTQILTAIRKKEPKSLKSLVLLSKNVPRETEYMPDHVLFEIENQFVIGFGLDYNEYYRGLPGIPHLHSGIAMKGIILAGGRGTRLYPVTLSVCKQLLPVYDKPMVYYPLSVLMMAGLREILLISTPQDIPRFQDLLGDGSDFGIQLSYAVQEKAEGIAQAFLIGESFIGDDSVALILGDNIFYGHSLPTLVSSCRHLERGGIIFGYEVKDPERYGVVEFDESGRVTDIVEKPQNPGSRFAVTGLYFYDNDVIDIARNLQPSERGEYEITDVNKAYLARGDLHLKLLDRGFAWLDTGTHASLQQASLYVQTIQERQGISIACLEEIAWQLGFISRQQLEKRAVLFSTGDYGQYLLRMLERDCPSNASYL